MLKVPGVIADALTVSDNGNGQVLALDLRHRKIWMLNTNGQVLTYLNLPGSDLAEAWTDRDIIASVVGRFDDLYVANALGQILLLRTE